MIETSFKSLRKLRQELTTVNSEAQFKNENIHSFLSAFLPDYRLINRPNEEPKVPKPVDVIVPTKPKVQIDFKLENGNDGEQKLPIPSISYEWSDSNPIHLPTYLPRLGKIFFKKHYYI